MAVFVQLLHPGVEPVIRRGSLICPANTGHTHKRKFLNTKADYLKNNHVINGDVNFWGEWELASSVQSLFPVISGKALPKYIHRPIWPQKVGNPAYCKKSYIHGYQNTDPFVFCDSFLYFCCQIRSGGILDKLTYGDLVVFGSHVGGQFVFDTVFVVADRVNAKHFSDECPDFLNVNGPHLITNQKIYRGATYSNQVNGMFSFFPCKFVDNKTIKAFPRPALPLSSYITPAKTQNFKATWVGNYQGMYNIWKQIVDIVINDGLVLGLRAYL